jgi:hypothetical protein
MSLTNLRNLETKALVDGTIDASEAKTLIGEAKTPEEKRVLRDMLSHDNFNSRARALVAQAVKNAPVASTLVGTKLGTYQSGKTKLDVMVSRELSPNEGYENRWQAMGAARASGVPNTTVIQDAKGKWHAVETNIYYKPPGTPAAKTSFKSVEPVPLPNAQRWTDLKKVASEKIQAWQANKTPENRKAAEDAYKALMAESLGVDATKINVIQREDQAVGGQLNFLLDLTHGEATTGTSKSKGMQPLAIGKKDTAVRNPSAITFGPIAFANPVHAGGVLVHEATHLQHQDRADQVLKDYRATGPKDTFTQYLLDRLDGKIKPKLTRDEYNTILEQTTERGGPGREQSEVLASTNEFFATFAHLDPGDPNALALKPLGDLSEWLALGALEEKALHGRFEAFYNTLDDDHRFAFDNEVLKLRRDFKAEIAAKGIDEKKAAKPPLYNFAHP